MTTTPRIITAIVIVSLTLICGAFAFEKGYNNYQKLLPFIVGCFCFYITAGFFTFIIHIINGFMGWKSILFD